MIYIRDWNTFQHYKDRNPPWIRLYARLLDDPELYELSDKAARILPLLWLIASRHSTDGSLPTIKTLAFQLRIDSKLLAEILNELNHWVIFDDSDLLAQRSQRAIPEQSRAEQSRDRGRGVKKEKQDNTKPLKPNEITIKFVEVFNDVFDRKIRSVGEIDKRVNKLIAEGYDKWKLLVLPIVQCAIDPNTGATRNFDPLMLLRTGEHGRTGENGATYGKTDWIQRAYGNADKFYCDARLSAIAYRHGLANIIGWLMKGMVTNENNQIPQMPIPGMASQAGRAGDRQKIQPQSIGENRQIDISTGEGV